MASNSRGENTSEKISTKSASCLRVLGVESLRRGRKGSFVQVMSMPSWGVVDVVD